jgi:hypothetical protein
MASEIKVDTISEKTSANGVTIDGVSLKDSKIATANSVDSDAYVDGSIDTAHIDALQVTGAKLNTDVISAQTELASAPADADEFMVSDGGVLKRIDYSLIKGGDNTPYFQVYLSANQTISDSTLTTVTFDSEEYDSGSDFASNTFTAPSTGYYYMYSQLGWASSTNATYILNRLMKNGSAINHNVFVQDESSSAYGGRIISLSASDTVTVQCYQNSGGDLPLYGGAAQACQFGGFKIIT